MTKEGDFYCPLCGSDEPHSHTPADRARLKPWNDKAKAERARRTFAAGEAQHD